MWPPVVHLPGSGDADRQQSLQLAYEEQEEVYHEESKESLRPEAECLGQCCLRELSVMLEWLCNAPTSRREPCTPAAVEHFDKH